MSTKDYQLSVAIEDAVSELGQRPIGRMLGVSHATVASHGSDLNKWPADQLLRLADLDDKVRGALIARVDPSRSLDVSISIEGQVLRSVSDAGGLIRDSVAAMTDGRIDESEARKLIAEVRVVQADLRVLETMLGRFAKVSP